MDDRVLFSRRMALCVLTLGVGLAISLGYGHVWDAIVIAVVMLPGIGLMLAWAYFRRKANARREDGVHVGRGDESDPA